jgi:hypothetical protein
MMRPGDTLPIRTCLLTIDPWASSRAINTSKARTSIWARQPSQEVGGSKAKIWRRLEGDRPQILKGRVCDSPSTRNITQNLSVLTDLGPQPLDLSRS